MNSLEENNKWIIDNDKWIIDNDTLYIVCEYLLHQDIENIYTLIWPTMSKSLNMLAVDIAMRDTMTTLDNHNKIFFRSIIMTILSKDSRFLKSQTIPSFCDKYNIVTHFIDDHKASLLYVPNITNDLDVLHFNNYDTMTRLINGENKNYMYIINDQVITEDRKKVTQFITRCLLRKNNIEMIAKLYWHYRISSICSAEIMGITMELTKYTNILTDIIHHIKELKRIDHMKQRTEEDTITQEKIPQCKIRSNIFKRTSPMKGFRQYPKNRY